MGIGLLNVKDTGVWLADDAKGSKCSKELRDWNKVNFQMGGVTLAAQVNVSAASAAEQSQLQEVGIDVAALQKAPCALQVALLPFGEKDQPLLFTGGLLPPVCTPCLYPMSVPPLYPSVTPTRSVTPIRSPPGQYPTRSVPHKVCPPTRSVPPGGLYHP